MQAAVAKWMLDWNRARIAEGLDGPVPAGRPNRERSDYNIHYPIMEADGDALDEIQAQVDAERAFYAQQDQPAAPAPEQPPAPVKVAAGLYSDPHSLCDTVYCRNPLHPGPCKGWRRQLDIPSRKRRGKGETDEEGHARRKRNRQRRQTRRAQPAAAPAKRPMTDEEFEARQQYVAATVAAAVPTYATEFTQTDSSGHWLPERDALHHEIAAELYARAAHVPRDGRAIIAGGLGGAGKSTVLRDHMGVDAGEYLTLNPDDVKEIMAERGLIPDVPGTDLSPMERAALVHEESSAITQLLAHMAYQDQTNVIWDITMSSQSSVDSRVSALRRHGYNDVVGVFVDIPVETSVDRALTRYRRGQDLYRAGHGPGGRFVPPAVIRAQQTPEGITVNRQTFDAMQGQFDTWTVFDNSGTRPVMVEEGFRT